MIFKTLTYQQKKSYAQVSKGNIKEVLKIKEAFPHSSDRKIINIVRVVRKGLSSFLIFFLFSIFYFLFSYFLFLAPRVRVSDDIGHMAQRRF